MRTWEPSKRAQEAIRLSWVAFERGDRWIRAEHPSTIRYTVPSLYRNGCVDLDPENPARFRISEITLNANGLTRRVPFFAGATFGEILTIHENIEAAEEAAGRSI